MMHRRPNPPRFPPEPGVHARKRRGISALELLVGVLIIGILSAVAVPRFLDSLAAHRAQQSAKRIVADLELARREATMVSGSRTVTFDVAGHRYTLHDVDHLDRPGEPYVIVLQEHPYQSALVSADLGGDAVVIFDGYGQADSGGTIVLRSGAIVATVVIDAATGRASVE